MLTSWCWVSGRSSGFFRLFFEFCHIIRRSSFKQNFITLFAFYWCFFCGTCRNQASVMVFGVDLLIMLRPHLILLKFANNRSCKSTWNSYSIILGIRLHFVALYIAASVVNSSIEQKFYFPADIVIEANKNIIWHYNQRWWDLSYLVDPTFNTFKIGGLSVLQVCAKVVIIRIEYNSIASYWIILHV